MFSYVIRRLVGAVLVIVFASMLVFGLFFYGPSDPGRVLCDASSGRCTPEQAERINDSLGFNDPVHEQYAVWAKGIFTGREIDIGGSTIDCPAPCFGISYQTKEPVTDILTERMPATISLAIGGAMVFLPLGVLLGVLAARKRGTATDKLLVGSSLLISSVPYYLLALMVYLYVVTQWGLVSAPEYHPITDNPLAWAGGLMMPWLVLGIASSTPYARFSRGSMVDALSEDFVRTARAKGMGERTVLVNHALHAALVPVVTIFGLDMATLLAGTVFTEKIFGIDGMGLEALEAVKDDDFPILAATVLLAAALVVVANMLVDFVYSVIDPRVRLS
ncbi:ABC transporter permease [Nocardioidaceae bacterium SCSIO 66511]|nr:ABC transporter permease [Nocardioidaceae bacterium SCSIO 66511]